MSENGSTAALGCALRSSGFESARPRAAVLHGRSDRRKIFMAFLSHLLMFLLLLTAFS